MPNNGFSYDPGKENFCRHPTRVSFCACRNYSVDTRPGSNSALVAKGTFDFDEMTALLDQHFLNVSLRQRIQLAPERAAR